MGSDQTPKVDKYSVVKQIGKGSMGVVFEAEHLDLGRRVALKVLDGSRELDIERFQREARAAGQIDHDNICEILDVGITADGRRYLAMPLLRGRSLRALLETEGPLPLGRVADIAGQTLAGIGAAHGAGIVHRDLKPDHVFLVRMGDRPDFVKILDFGIAKLLHPPEDEAVITQKGDILGTPSYMAPEQAGGGADVDHLVDIYAVGVILYEMTTGTRPFTGKDLRELLSNIWNAPVPRPRASRPELPEGLEQVVLKALRRDPAERYSSAEAMRDALIAACSQVQQYHVLDIADTVDIEGEASLQPSEVTEHAEERRGPRSRLPLVAIVSLLAVVSALAYLIVGHAERGQTGAPATETASLWPDADPESMAPSPHADARGSVEVGTDGVPANIPTDAPATVRVSLSGLPQGARVTVDGIPIEGSSTLVAPSPTPVHLRVRARGCRDWTRSIVVTTPTDVVVQLIPLSPDRRPARHKREEVDRDSAPEPGGRPRAIDTFGAVP